jgi:hypothetical protein
MIKSVAREGAMFGFGRKAEIEARAKSIGDLMLLMVSCVNSMPLKDFLEANHRRGFVDGEVDLRTGEYSFSEREITSADFVFHVDYGEIGGPTVQAAGYGNYFGLLLNSAGPDTGVGVDFLETHDRANTLGRDARAMRKALLKFPGFHSTRDILKHLGIDE